MRRLLSWGRSSRSSTGVSLITLVTLIPGLLLLHAEPAVADLNPAIASLAVRGEPAPVQLSGTAAGLPSLVGTDRTATTVQVKSPSKEVAAPKKALPLEGRFVKEAAPSTTTAPSLSKKQQKQREQDTLSMQALADLRAEASHHGGPTTRSRRGIGLPRPAGSGRRFRPSRDGPIRRRRRMASHGYGRTGERVRCPPLRRSPP